MTALKSLKVEGLKDARFQKRIEFLENELDKLNKLFKIISNRVKIKAEEVLPFLREEDILNYLLTSEHYNVIKYTKLKYKGETIKEYQIKWKFDFSKAVSIRLKEKGNSVTELTELVKHMYDLAAGFDINSVQLTLDLLKGRET